MLRVARSGRTSITRVRRQPAIPAVAEPMPGNARDTKYYSHYPFKRLGAEQLLDALTTVTGVPEKFDGFPIGTRAMQLPDSAVPSYFLDLFGRPARTTTSIETWFQGEGYVCSSSHRPSCRCS